MNEVFKIIDEYKEKLEILIKDLNKEIRAVSYTHLRAHET